LRRELESGALPYLPAGSPPAIEVRGYRLRVYERVPASQPRT
jgi:hypothetical protein